MKKLRFCAALAVTTCIVLQAHASVAAPGVCPGGIAGVLKPFANLVGVKVDFVEEKRIALLTKPLVNRGTVLFMAPNSLVRRVDSPSSSAIWLKAGELWVRDKTGERKLDVTRWGPANVLINSFLYVLRGDYISLGKHYQIDLTCDNAAWSMRLTPRQADLARIVRFMVINGRGADAESLELLDGSGDRSVTRFGKADTKARFTSEQLKRQFSSAAP